MMDTHGMSHETSARLSPQSQCLWAKTGNGNQTHLWKPLYVHLSDTAEILRILWRNWLSPHCRHLICKAAGQDDPDALEPFICFIAGVHDIGKAHPGFQSKIPDRWETVQETGLGGGGALLGKRYLHAGVGEVLLRDWLIEEHHADAYDACGWGSVVGNHHGMAPNNQAIMRLEGSIRLLDETQEAAWAVTRRELFEWVASNTLGHDMQKDPLSSVPHIEARGQILLAGMLIMADWIASNQELCPLVESPGPLYACRDEP